MSSPLTIASFTPTLPVAEVSGFSSATPPAAVNPLGAFGAILDALVTKLPIVGALLPNDGAAEITQDSTQTMSAAIGGLLKIEVSTPPVATPLTPAAEPAAPRDLKDIVSDLGDLLAAIDTALAAGKQPEPSVTKKLEATVSELAVALGMPVTPAAARQLPSTEPRLSGTEPTLPVSQATSAAPETPLPLTQIAETMTRIAQRFAQSGDGLPQKLAEVAAALTNPALAPAIAAKLGIEAGAAIAAEIFDLPLDLYKPQVKTAVATPPQPFTPAALKLPEPETAVRPVQPRASREPDIEPDAEVRAAKPAPDIKPIDAPAKPNAVAADAPPPKPQVSPSPLQDPTLTVQAPAPATIRAMHAAYQAPPTPTPQINIPQLAVEIARHVVAGQSRFEIRLDPPELGRIDVRMDLDAGGTLNAKLTVERAETLDLLQRDHRQLERALQQAGLDQTKTNLEFSLKQNPFDRAPGGQQQNHQPTWLASRDKPHSTDPEATPPAHLYRATATAGGLNIFV